MNIIRQGKVLEPKKLTVSDMEPGTVYRVWSPFDGSEADSGYGRVCLKLLSNQTVILAASANSDAYQQPHLAMDGAPHLCGHPSVRVAEVYGRLTGVEVAPV